jgi:hypothetical protein
LPHLPAIVREPASFLFTFRQRGGGTGNPGTGYIADGIRYRLEASTDLTSPWTPAVGAELVGAPMPNGDGSENVTLRVTKPAENSFFLRLRVDEE